MARQETATTIINRAALEVGLTPVSDAVASSDPAFIQLTGLLTAAGQELVELNEWQGLRQELTFTTSTAGQPLGSYTLPDDFSYMLDQSGWDTTNNNYVAGPLSPQDWSYLIGRDLSSSTIYTSFRITEDKLELYPRPPPDATAMRFEYISRWWVQENGQAALNTDAISAGNDLVVYEPLLVVKFLKVKFLEAKGFDASAARLEFETMFQSRTSRDTGSVILSASNNHRGFPYLNPFRNTGDSGYG